MALQRLLEPETVVDDQVCGGDGGCLLRRDRERVRVCVGFHQHAHVCGITHDVSHHVTENVCGDHDLVVGGRRAAGSCASRDHCDQRKTRYVQQMLHRPAFTIRPGCTPVFMVRAIRSESP